jgi:hypothetical protein
MARPYLSDLVTFAGELSVSLKQHFVPFCTSKNETSRPSGKKLKTIFYENIGTNKET